jgi:hypothetical protein
MRKIIVILICFLLIIAGVPLFAHGHRGHHHGWHNGHHWHGSGTHPAFHGWRGWGHHNPAHNPAGPPAEPPGDPTEPPPGDPQEDPGDKPGGGSGGSGGKDGEIPMDWTKVLNPSNGSLIG